VEFGRESVDDIAEEIIPLIVDHYREISPLQGLTLKPDLTKYFHLEYQDALRIYTARTPDKELVGYQVFMLGTHPHFSDAKFASQDLLYIHPDHRGFGMKFIACCDDQLKEDGVAYVKASVAGTFDYSPMLERLGYRFIEKIYMRELPH